MRRIKHFAGYGTVLVGVVKDESCTLHIRVKGDHECGLLRNDIGDLYTWLVKRFDKSIPDMDTWRRMYPSAEYEHGSEDGIDTIDYYFYY